ncbi:MAG: hypothetical protein J6A42_01140 [Firmicutes bacterium]|nr:hypothetical protein [Bacillota bacterium]
MSSDFSTSIKIKGTRAECLAFLRVMNTCVFDQGRQYDKTRDCWYLGYYMDNSETPDDAENEEILDRMYKNGGIDFEMDGPWGVFPGTLFDVNLFERIADAAPSASFEGTMAGWDPGASYCTEAELKNGLLRMRHDHKEHSWDDDEEETDSPERSADDWDTIYDPIQHKYLKDGR